MARATSWYIGGGHDGAHRVVRGAVGPRHQQRVAAGHDAFGDRGDLVGRLAQAEDDLGKALALGPLMVDPGKAQVFDWLGAHFSGDLLGGLGRAKVTGGDPVEQHV